MANKRMLTMKIVDSDEFLDMPLSAQCLYFHLNMRADDDGFIGKPMRIMQIVGASADDLKLLIAKRFVLTFDDGVIVVKHLKMHNILSQGSYYEIDKDVIIATPQNDVNREDVQGIVEKWNELKSFGIKPIARLQSDSKRYKSLVARIREYGIENVELAINNIKESDYCRGKNKYGWVITFDWFVCPNNFPKVFEGNYDNRKGIQNGEFRKATRKYDDRITNGGTKLDEGGKLF